MVSSVSVIFETRYTYSHYSNMLDFVRLKEKKFPRNIKGTAKDLEIYGFEVYQYSVRSVSGRMITLQYQVYHVPR